MKPAPPIVSLLVLPLAAGCGQLPGMQTPAATSPAPAAQATEATTATQATLAAQATAPTAAKPLPGAEIAMVATAGGGKLALYHWPGNVPPSASNESGFADDRAAGDRRRVVSPGGTAVLLLHPYSVPGAAAFAVEGLSWAARLAADGFDVWALDFRGFGRSGGAHLVPVAGNRIAPAQRAEDSLRDALAAIEAIRARRPGRRVSLVGWGYGGLIAGMAAASAPDKVGRLALFGTAFAHALKGEAAQLAKAPLERGGRLDPALPPYQAADWENGTWTEWRLMMKGQPLAEPAAVAAARAAFLAGDYREGEGETRLRRPTGPLVDAYQVYSGHELFPPAKIHAETLVIRGELDLYAEPNLAKKLKGARRAEEVVIPAATHWLPYEREREKLFARVSAFLRP